MRYDAAYFREKAAHCRRLAKIAATQQLRTELLRFAEEFEAEASKLERQPDSGEGT